MAYTLEFRSAPGRWHKARIYHPYASLAEAVTAARALDQDGLIDCNVRIIRDGNAVDRAEYTTSL